MKTINCISLLLHVCILWFASLFVGSAVAQTNVEVWVRRYGAPGEGNDTASRILRDNSGNLIVVGTTDDGISGVTPLIIKYSSTGVPLWTNVIGQPVNVAAVDGGGNIFVTGGGTSGYLTRALSSNGALLWTNQFHSFFNTTDNPAAMTVDDAGNVIITGNTTSFGSSSASRWTIAYSGGGVLLWSNRFDGPLVAVGSAVAANHSGNVFVTGVEGMIVSGFDPLVHFATVALSNTGVPLWTNRYDGGGHSQSYPISVTVNSSGNVIVSGHSLVDYKSDYHTVAYSGAGIPLWTNVYDGPGNGNDKQTSIAVDGSGNTFITGYSRASNGYNDFATLAYSDTGAPLWTNRYDGPANNEDQASAVAVDSAGNVFVTGFSTGITNSADYTTVAYSGAGLPLWTNRYDGPKGGYDQALSMAMDPAGKMFITGNSSGTSSDIATLAYSSPGVPLWTNRFAGTANVDDSACAVVTDNAGNVFVAGNSFGDGHYDYATVAYSSGGNPLWTNRYNGPINNDDKIQAMAVDSSGNVFVMGTSKGDATDIATVAYSNGGTPLWTNRYAGPANADDYPQGIAVDAAGNIIVAGYSAPPGATYCVTIAYSNAGMPLWTNFYGPTNGVNFTQAMAVDGIGKVFISGYAGAAFGTVAYSGAGVPLWTNLYRGPDQLTDYTRAMAVDSSGNVIVTGNSQSSSNHYDYATVAYSNGGVPLWTNRYNGPANNDDIPFAMAVDSLGNVFITGYSIGISNQNDYATVAYSSAGIPLWTNRYNGTASGDDRAVSVRVDGSGNVFVAGQSPSGGGNSTDYVTVSYSRGGVPLTTNRYNGPASGDDNLLTSQALALSPDGSVLLTGGSDASFVSSIHDFATIKYRPEFPPLIAVQPAKQILIQGSNVNFFVSASGSASLAYQWLFNGAPISGATNSSLALSNVSSTNQGSYWVIITNSYGSVTSSVASFAIPGWNRLIPTLLGGGSVQLSYVGVSNSLYVLDRAFGLSPPNWTPQLTNPAGPNGAVVFTNTANPNTNNFWRVRSLP